MIHASLFSGIGGPEVAAAMLGWDNAFHCEINPFGKAVLEYWFPSSKSYDDITKASFKEWRGRIDVLTGGFPCQPFSYAGKRGGRNDDRYLWPEMLRVIDEVRPTWVVGENVAGITTMVEGGVLADMGCDPVMFGEGDGLHRYQLRERFTIERICADLEGLGYSVQPLLIPAAAVGAPHRRDRVFIVAHDADADGGDAVRGPGVVPRERGTERIQERDEVREPGIANHVRSEVPGPSTDTAGYGLHGCEGKNGEERCSGADTVRTSEKSADRVGFRCESRIHGEQFDAPDTDNDTRGSCTIECRREESISSREEGRRVCYTTARPGESRTSADTPDLGLQRTLNPRAKGEICGEMGGERNHPQRIVSAAPDGLRRPATDALCRDGQGKQQVEREVARRDGIDGNGREWDATHTNGAGREEPVIPGRETHPAEDGTRIHDRIERPRSYGDAPDSVIEGLERENESGNGEEGERVHLRRDATEYRGPGLHPDTRWASFPTVSPVHRGNDGLPFPLDDLTIPATKWRTESLKAYGNAIVPQVMYRIFQAIEAAQ